MVRSCAELFGGPISREALSLQAPMVSLSFLPLALLFVYRIASDGWGEGTARGAVLALAFFPTAFFLNAAYTESVFLALSAGSVWALRVRRNLLLACVMAGLASATRNVGVFLLVPSMMEWIEGRDRHGWRGAYLALVPSGLLAYMGYLWARFGDAFLFYSAQEYRGRRATGPLATLTGALSSAVEAGASSSTPASGPIPR